MSREEQSPSMRMKVTYEIVQVINKIVRKID